MTAPAPPLSGTFTATGVSATAIVYGDFTASIWGTPLNADGSSGSFTASVQVQRSADEGTTWIPVSVDGTGSPATYTTAAAVQGNEPVGVYYRFSCLSHSAGTVNYALAGTVL